MIEPLVSVLHFDETNGLTSKFDDMVGMFDTNLVSILRGSPKKVSFDEMQSPVNDIAYVTALK